MQVRAARRQNLTCRAGGIALPVGHDPACRFDHRAGGCDVIGLQTRFDHQINLPMRQQRVSVAIHPVAGQAALLRNPFKRTAFIGCAHFGKGGKQDRLGQVGLVTGAQRCSPHGAGHAGNAEAPNEAFPDKGLVDHAQKRAIVIGHRNQHPPAGCPAEIRPRAVNRVHDPCQAGCPVGRGKFLAGEAVIGPPLRQCAPQSLFRGAVGLRDRIKAGAALGIGDQCAAAEKAQRFGPRDICQIMTQLQQIGLHLRIKRCSV